MSIILRHFFSSFLQVIHLSPMHVKLPPGPQNLIKVPPEVTLLEVGQTFKKVRKVWYCNAVHRGSVLKFVVPKPRWSLQKSLMSSRVPGNTGSPGSSRSPCSGPSFSAESPI